MPIVREISRQTLLRRGIAFACATLGWQVAGIAVLAVAALAARSVALAGLGLDSLLEAGASAVVLGELTGTGKAHRQLALRLVGGGFALLAGYLAIQSTLVLVDGFHARHSPLGIGWTAATAAVLSALAAGQARTGAALDNQVLRTEARVALVYGALAVAVLLGLLLGSVLGWWWADPLVGYLLAAYAAREALGIFRAKR
ncbi:cation transporter [Kitasatospora sp. NBC_01266]|uniref:cation transporter n=1 Tax=Kitasatospora sp. NBC_01266 TaxID=2903572 RepID=UPI002E351E35|nr:cation transporter [Kitasatospora sp. NBC_01266]